MSGRTIKLKWPARCTDCGATLVPGERARFYGRDRIYGTRCHKQTRSASGRTAYERGDRSPGAIASHYDRTGFYSADGKKLGSSCGCIDYPCCGH